MGGWSVGGVCGWVGCVCGWSVGGWEWEWEFSLRAIIGERRQISETTANLF